MAEAAGDPPPEDALGKRIQEWFASPKGQAAFLDGFYGQGGIGPTLAQFKERERKRLPYQQGQLLKGGKVGSGEIAAIAPPEEDLDLDIDLICIWCGKKCDTLDDLDRHEDRCQDQ